MSECFKLLICVVSWVVFSVCGARNSVNNVKTRDHISYFNPGVSRKFQRLLTHARTDFNSLTLRSLQTVETSAELECSSASPVCAHFVYLWVSLEASDHLFCSYSIFKCKSTNKMQINIITETTSPPGNPPQPSLSIVGNSLSFLPPPL